MHAAGDDRFENVAVGPGLHPGINTLPNAVHTSAEGASLCPVQYDAAQNWAERHHGCRHRLSRRRVKSGPMHSSCGLTYWLAVATD